MTTTPLRAARSDIDAVIAENVATLLHRTRETASDLARSLGMSKATLSRKMTGAGGWYYVEVAALADHFDVTPAELAGELPSLREWRACRDSNPKPSVLELRRRLVTGTGTGELVRRLSLVVNHELTANRIPSGASGDESPAPVPAPLRVVSA